jgi:hypothetical protein
LKALVSCWLLLALLVPRPLLAATYLEGFVVDYDGFRGGNLFLEQAGAAGTSVFLNTYRDADFQSTYVGIARMFGNLQVAFSAGEANTDFIDTVSYNPWLWYQAETLELYLEYEYLQDAPADNYYRGYLHKSVTQHFFTGVYSERLVGTGPTFGAKFGSGELGLRLEFSTPVINKPRSSDGAVDVVVYATVWANF